MDKDNIIQTVLDHPWIAFWIIYVLGYLIALNIGYVRARKLSDSGFSSDYVLVMINSLIWPITGGIVLVTLPGRIWYFFASL